MRRLPRMIDWDESKLKARVQQLIVEGIFNDNTVRNSYLILFVS